MIHNRPRRNRKSEAIRLMVVETHLHPNQLVQPLFLLDGNVPPSPIASLPGTYRLSLEYALREIEQCLALGIHSFILFPIIDEMHKDREATYSYQSHNFYLHHIQQIKSRFPQACLITDVAMDPYSSDGHDGLVVNDHIDNDLTLPILSAMAIAQARAGADIIGPSDMMDGRVAAIRAALDDEGLTNTSIMSYTAKYASAFYGPFRDALASAPKKGDKKTYQMNPANYREALREAALDAIEGADYLMVKPALHYLDVIAGLKANFNLPIAAYHVSGECAMLLAACRNGWLQYDRAMPETLLSLRRAGTDVLITYFAKDFARWHKGENIIPPQ